MADTAAELAQRGWHLAEAGLEECTEAGKRNVQAAVQAALDFDLRGIGKKFLPDDVNRGKIESIDGPCVLQIQKVRNISAPKDNEDSQAAPRLLKVTMTDGQITCNGIESETLSQISLGTPPGTKVLLSGNIRLNQGFLQLTNNNTKVLGGKVEKMVETWELKRTLAKQSRSAAGSDDGPPPFIPFGQKRVDKGHNYKKRDNFKSLETTKTAEKKDDEFEQQRQAIIAEALQAKEGGKGKMFVGKQVQDKDVARIVEMGFTADQASTALKNNNGNVEEAINSLVSSDRAGQRERDYGYNRGFEGRGRGRGQDRGERPERGVGRGRRNQDGTEYEPSRPSTNISLFDFLETKIPVKEDSIKESSSSSQSERTRHKSDPRQNTERKANLPPRLQKLQAQKEVQESLSTTNDEAYPELSSSRNDKENKRGQERKDTKMSAGKIAPHQPTRDKAEYDSGKFQQNQHNSGNRDRRQNYLHDQNYQGGYNNRRPDRGQRYENKSNYENYDNRSQPRGRYNDSSRQDQNFDRKNRGRNYQENRRQNEYQMHQNDYHPRQNRQNYQQTNYNHYDNPQQRGDGQYKGSYNPGKQRHYESKQQPQNFDQSQQQGYESQQAQLLSYDNQQPQTVYDNQQPLPPQPMSNPEAIMTQQPQFSSAQYVIVSQPQDVLSSYSSANSQEEIIEQTSQVPAYVQAKGGYMVQPTIPNQRQWKSGDYCRAKYWEDNKFYKAIIQGLNYNVQIAQVLFVEYGNCENVNMSDVKPISREAWGDMPSNIVVSQPQQYAIAAQPVPIMITDPYQGQGQYINTMEFHGNGIPVNAVSQQDQQVASVYPPQPYNM